MKWCSCESFFNIQTDMILKEGNLIIQQTLLRFIFSKIEILWQGINISCQLIQNDTAIL